jgi:bacterioferritin
MRTVAHRIIQLGGEPDSNPEGLATRNHSEYVEGSGLEEMIREDLVAERVALESYGEVIRYRGENDPTTRPMLEEILAVEEEHAGPAGPTGDWCRERARSTREASI